LTVAGRHIAIIAPPTAGHINPLVALGTSLVAAGHRVTLVHMADVAAMLPRGDVAFAPLGRLSGSRGMMLRVLSGTQRGWFGKLRLPEEFLAALERY